MNLLDRPSERERQSRQSQHLEATVSDLRIPGQATDSESMTSEDTGRHHAIFSPVCHTHNSCH